MKELTMAALVAGATGLTKADAWDKTFPKSDKVEHCKATFKNRFGISLAADVYKPKEGNGELGMGNGKFAAIAVSGPFGAVKEQSSGLYAQTLAERGFLTIAFDPSYTGESSGEPRYVASPDINTEDFQAAVDYLISRDDVDADNFLDRLESDVAVLRKAVARVEECEGVGGEPWSIMREQRQLFIHEVIDASVKLKALNI